LSIRFSAIIYQRGTSARIDVPEKVTKAFGDSGYVPVCGTMNDAGIRGTLMPAGGGRQVLNINLEMRTRAGINVGDTVVFTLDRGEATRFPPMSRELVVALEQEPVAKTTWEGRLSRQAQGRPRATRKAAHPGIGRPRDREARGEA